MRVIAVTNQKGGVGKTTTTQHLAAALGEMGERVLAVDLDAQATLTMAAGIKVDSLAASVYQVLVAESRSMSDIIVATEQGYDLASADPDMGDADIHLRARKLNWHLTLARALDGVADNYEWCLIDCPPALTALTVNALQAAHDILIPVSPEAWPVKGMQRLFECIGEMRETNKELRIAGIIPTLVRHDRSHSEMLDRLHDLFPEAEITAAVPVSAHFSRAARAVTTVLHRAPTSAGAEAYRSIARRLRDADERTITGSRAVLTAAPR